VESLKNGVIKISKYNANAPYTIFLVGGIGVGKSSIMEFIANVLLRKVTMSKAVSAIKVERAPSAFTNLQARAA